MSIHGSNRGNLKRDLVYSECLSHADHTISFRPRDRPKRKASLSLDVEIKLEIHKNLACLIPNFILFWLLHFDSTVSGIRNRRKQLKLA